MDINLGRSERQPGAYVIWLQAELRVVSMSDALFDESMFPWRPKGDERLEEPPPLPGDGDAAQPPTLPPADEGHTNPSRIESNLAVEFARDSQKWPHLVPRIGAARLSRRVLILFSGPYARPDGLVAFLQRLGLEVVPVDNDSSGGDKAHDLLRNDFYSNLLRRAQRGEFLVIWAAPPCSTFSICRFLPTRTPGGGPPIIRRRQEGQVTGARDCPQKNRRELKVSNELTSRTIAILRAGFDAGSECGLENPVDAGDEDHPEHLVDREHAPALWLMPEVIAFKKHAGCREVTFPQCAFGSMFRKMTIPSYPHEASL